MPSGLLKVKKKLVQKSTLISSPSTYVGDASSEFTYSEMNPSRYTKRSVSLQCFHLQVISPEMAMMIPSATSMEWKMKNWYESGLTNALSTGTLVVNMEGMARAASAPSIPVEYMKPSTFSLFFSSSVVLTKKIRMICTEQKCSGRWFRGM